MKFYRKYFNWIVFPAMSVFFLVMVVPFLLGFAYSFTPWRGTYFDPNQPLFIGLDNYIKLFNNSALLRSFTYTVKLVVISVILQIGIGLGLALAISKLTKGKGIFRSALFLPNFIGGIVLGYIFAFVFNALFSKVLFTNPDSFFYYMLQDRTKHLWAMAMMLAWQSIGYLMIIFLASLNTIPQHLIEAAKIDGANSFQRFWNVTLPLLMPAMTISLFITVSGTFKVFDQNIALTNGNFDTRLISLEIFRIAAIDSRRDYGLAQAAAFIFFIVIAVITISQVAFTKRREVEM
jgi:raffinose/stachyose/melibiose transport system permease protein